jgi:hypothetical protein
MKLSLYYHVFSMSRILWCEQRYCFSIYSLQAGNGLICTVLAKNKISNPKIADNKVGLEHDSGRQAKLLNVGEQSKNNQRSYINTNICTCGISLQGGPRSNGPLPFFKNRSP